MMMKSVIWWRKPEYPEETTDLRQVTDETFHTLAYIGFGRDPTSKEDKWNKRIRESEEPRVEQEVEEQENMEVPEENVLQEFGNFVNYSK